MELFKSVTLFICFLICPNFLTASDTHHLGLCADAQCSKPIGVGQTLLSYTSIEDSKFSFKPGDKVFIYAKECGIKKDLLGVKYNSIESFINVKFVKEQETWERNLVPGTFKVSVYPRSIITSSSSISMQKMDGIVTQSQPSLDVNQHIQVSNTLQKESIESPVFDSLNIKKSIYSEDLHSSMNLANTYLDKQSDIDLTSDHVQFSSDSLPQQSATSSSMNEVDSVDDESTPEADKYFNTVDEMVKELTKSRYQDVFSSSHIHSIGVQSDFGSRSPLLNAQESSKSPAEISENDINSEVSETLALLKKRGVEESDILGKEHYNPSHSTNSYPNHNTDQRGYLNYIHSHGTYSTSGEVSSSNSAPSITEHYISTGNERNTSAHIPADFNKPPESVSNHISPSQIEQTNQISMDYSHENEQASSSYNNVEDVSDSTEEEDEEDFGINSEENEESENYPPTGVHNPEPTPIKDDGSKLIETLSPTESLQLAADMTKIVSEHQPEWIQRQSFSSFEPSQTVFVEPGKSIPVQSPTFSSVINDPSFELNSLLTDTEMNRQSTEEHLSETTLVDDTVANFIAPSLESEDSFTKLQETPTVEIEKDGISSPEVDSIHVIETNSPSDSYLKNSEIENSLLYASTENEFYEKEMNSESFPPVENSVFNEVENEDFLHSDKNSIDDSVLSTYQVRDLKSESLLTEEPSLQNHDSNPDYEIKGSLTDYVESFLEAIRAFTETVMMLIPEPLYSYIMDFDNKGIPPRAIVFTALSAVPCLFLIIGTVYIKETSKERTLSDQLLVAEKRLHSLSVEKQVLEEKLQVVTSELSAVQLTMEKENGIIEKLNLEVCFSKEQMKDIEEELRASLQTIEFYEKKEAEYLDALSALQKEKRALCEQNENLEKRLKEEEDSVSSLAMQVQECEEEITKINKEKEVFLEVESDNAAKISQLQQNCNQLLQEAEVWNSRVSELSEELSKEKSLKESYEDSVAVKEQEIESLKNAMLSLESMQNLTGSEENNSNDLNDRLKSLMDVSSVKIQLQQEQKEKETLLEKLTLEKNKALDYEVELLEVKSEVSKLKISYDQALQDKTEAQTKLDILSNYFKDKEIQLQKQLGAQEAVRQKNEDDATSAERRVCLIEEENVSYKYQVASMKHEMDETERNLKNQIATQEKKAHENWLCARAAERKLEELKQEAAQLRQRLTLFERDSETQANPMRDDIIRPVPKRFPMPNEKSLDGNMEPRFGVFESHLPPPPPMLLPPDRPLPPLLPPFLPPHMDPAMPFRPWPAEPEFRQGRGRLDHDTSSPLGDSRNSTPPHALPRFHDVPPFFGPPLGHARFPLPPPPKKKGHRIADAHPTDPSLPPDRWRHPHSEI